MMTGLTKQIESGSLFSLLLTYKLFFKKRYQEIKVKPAVLSCECSNDMSCHLITIAIAIAIAINITCLFILFKCKRKTQNANGECGCSGALIDSDFDLDVDFGVIEINEKLLS
ncbi:hypothetical protein J3Q64DRAFT_1699240 [Phycomyces blakesleeanus]|uniref:Uncharacterized protein n=2 Tax=Phycomyces blakesleeanus TaxID=4837 RepID=A0A162XAG9_PHYB8|nr:hypothetical protein PHYBLDRAFT_168889 [Phycomyces blakesleeanus NRRL 1555(-)]OAD73545.1 hypothetical protein PHYBLDRAFT_168889 [Phycomyces blakesleeanus NRRL 1555(-)]|eukprot:XP_018291585.1 hypothetical protein PHYBLDRAFT_168889 [Phycomyces blakesleeanus NRRL 1555(-)]